MHCPPYQVPFQGGRDQLCGPDSSPYTPLALTAAAWGSLFRNSPESMGYSVCPQVFRARIGQFCAHKRTVVEPRLQSGRHPLVHTRWSVCYHQALIQGPCGWCLRWAAQPYYVGIIIPISQMRKPRPQRLNNASRVT